MVYELASTGSRSWAFSSRTSQKTAWKKRSGSSWNSFTIYVLVWNHEKFQQRLHSHASIHLMAARCPGQARSRLESQRFPEMGSLLYLAAFPSSFAAPRYSCSQSRPAKRPGRCHEEAAQPLPKRRTASVQPFT